MEVVAGLAQGTAIVVLVTGVTLIGLYIAGVFRL